MSATADGVPFEPAATGGRRRGVLRGVLTTPSGLLGAGLTTTLTLVAVFAPALAPYDPFAIDGPVLRPPSAAHPLGTDALGRDMLSGVLYGTRTSLFVAGTVGVLVLLIGSLVGAVSGYTGRWTDDVLMRLTEAFQVLPRFFLAIVVIAFFGPGIDRLVLVLGFTSWPMLARVVRGEVLSLKQREFVAAAQAHGASSVRVVVREILPNALPAAIALLGLILAQVILIEASLGFLGLGDPNAMSWGYLANEAQRFLRVAWWLPLFPGLAILLAVLGLNLLGDALTDILGGRR
ncbi:ABC transporter permease [Haloechinothrix salitolerans]|uniref:ABC transporter permease n=1 Tax=Haloechinothrix salitolerans TaxID=926830 RepID=A0ABW2BZK3_9PSEU